ITSMNKIMAAIMNASSEEELIGKNILEVEPIIKSGLGDLVMQALEGIPSKKDKVHYVPAPDKAFYLHVKVIPLSSETGETETAIMIAMDVTSNVRLESQLERSYEKLIQMYQELEQVTKMKTQFIDVASHELRTPLTVLRGYLDLVETDFPGTAEPKLAEKIKIIRANADKLCALIEGMLDVSRLEKGTLQINPEPTRIDSLLREVVEARSDDAADKRQALSLEIEGELPIIMADRRRIRDVFNSILDNAVKYTPEDGKVQIGARDEGKTVHVWVKDNGVGIPLENLGKIFDRFYIVSNDDVSHSVNRIGLSLPISKGIVEAHEGRVWVESHVGRGSVFHIGLPKRLPK
ncbi:MAG: HAMP domain-containing histidine kinase, partial [Methanobacteriota archaeon]